MYEFIDKFFFIILAYCIGALPTGYLFAKYKGIDDIRKHGSGNIGATNIARTLGFRFFFIIFFLDLSKAFCISCVVGIYFNDIVMNYITAFALLLGNSFSIFLNFTGGKGIATALGIALYLFPSILPILLFFWISFFTVTKTVGIACCATVLLLPSILLFFSYDFSLVIFSFFISTFILGRHWVNIRLFFHTFFDKG